jgi:hypothetical protein
LPYKNGKTFFAQLIFFPPNFFFCLERFPFSKIAEKILAGKKLTEQKSFFAEQKCLFIRKNIFHTIREILIYFSDEAEYFNLVWGLVRGP